MKARYGASEGIVVLLQLHLWLQEKYKFLCDDVLHSSSATQSVFFSFSLLSSRYSNICRNRVRALKLDLVYLQSSNPHIESFGFVKNQGFSSTPL